MEFSPWKTWPPFWIERLWAQNLQDNGSTLGPVHTSLMAVIKYGVSGLRHLRMWCKSDLLTHGWKFPPLNVVNMEPTFCAWQNQNTQPITSLPHNITVNNKFHVKPTLYSVHCKCPPPIIDHRSKNIKFSQSKYYKNLSISSWTQDIKHQRLSSFH